MKAIGIVRTGIVGSAVAAVCCATPILVIALGAFGLSAWTGWVDYVVIPALAFFLALTAYGLWRRSAASCCSAEIRSKQENVRDA